MNPRLSATIEYTADATAPTVTGAMCAATGLINGALFSNTIQFDYVCNQVSVDNTTNIDIVATFYIRGSAQGTRTFKAGTFSTFDFSFDSIVITGSTATSGTFWVKGRA